MNVVFLALAFLAELAAWGAIGVATYVLAGSGVRGWLAAIIGVLVAIVLWGLVASPKAKAPPVAGLVTKVVEFGGAVALLALVGHPFWAAALGLLIVVAHAGVRATMPLRTAADS
jgi:hypothetical protein